MSMLIDLIVVTLLIAVSIFGAAYISLKVICDRGDDE